MSMLLGEPTGSLARAGSEESLDLTADEAQNKFAFPQGKSPRTALATIRAANWTREQIIVAAIVAAAGVRLVCAALMPLATDEVLYWRYSNHLAPGFLDHPAFNPLLIRLGTTLFGDNPFGVRVFAVLLGLPASWAVWRAADAFFPGTRAGANAALFLAVTPVMTVGSMLATSDGVVVATSAFLLYALAKLNQTGRGMWWLAIGAAFGLGMFAKYTTFFFAISIAAWLLVTPSQRKWILNPWPYAGALLAALIFVPVLVWNAEHHWASAAYQSSRMVIHQWTIRYLIELVAALIGLATPSIFILACIGMARGPRSRGAETSAYILLAAMIAPTLSYFLWHSLHERVQANWPECVFPAVACVAAMASVSASAGAAPWKTWAQRLAAPVGALLAILVYAQAVFGVFPLGAKDPTSRELGFGWPALGAQIDAVREAAGAKLLVATNYSLASELAYYLPSHAPAEQINERIRWINEPALDPALLQAPVLYVCKNSCGHVGQLSQRFRHTEFLATFARKRAGVAIERYSVYRLTGPVGAVFSPVYPIHLKGSGDDSL
jgi:4-amino-4-deoxy-L-arabinose transferase-like glycosyltransferase